MLGVDARRQSDDALAPAADVVPERTRDGAALALRADLRRGVDARERAFAVLDRIERGGCEDERLAALVERAQGGDAMAFAELYIALFDRVHRWLQIALKDREDAADAAQQVFLQAFEALPRYVEGQGFRPWVFSIARNLAYDRLRAASHSTHAMEPSELAERRDRLPEALRQVGADAAADDIGSLIAHLPITQRRVLTLRFVSDYATDDIADVLDISADAVRHVQQRALRSLARSLATCRG